MDKMYAVKGFLFLLVLSISTILQAQHLILTDKAIEHVKTAEALPQFEGRVQDSYVNKKTTHTYLYLIQQHEGIDVHNAISNFVFNAENEKLYSIEQAYNVQKMNVRSAVGIPADKAIHSMMEHLEYTNSQYQFIPLLKENQKDQRATYEMDISAEEVVAKLVYYPTNKNELTLCWEVSFLETKSNIWWDYFISAEDASIIHQGSWTVTCQYGHSDHSKHDHSDCLKQKKSNEKLSSSMLANTYNVFGLPVESPLYGTRSMETSPWDDAVNASPFGWHDTDGVAGEEYTITRGNNVFAYDDLDSDNAPGHSPDGGVDLEFNFSLELDSFNPPGYMDAALTNLFYWNNVIHDVLYQYGFDEASGNFQENNYGNGGSDSDYVNAESIDGSGTNNANFSTPPDGSNPRMQMYQWGISSTPPSFDVNTPAAIAGAYDVAGASFGPALEDITGDLELAEPNEACTAITNTADIDGKIAIIDRGTCAFVVKVKEAQNAGAIAVVICNNQATDVFTMGGVDTTIHIPSVMMSQADCDEIKLNLPVNVSMEFFGPSSLDSDLDNGVIIHEYGHGVSNRLTGGPSASSCLSGEEQMGEGWSDYLALMLTMESVDTDATPRGMGNYLVEEADGDNGIRAYPYTVDMAINPFTYDGIKSAAVPHGVGSVWCTMIWDVSWALINEYGYDPDLYNGTAGNNIALNLVMEGMKLQPCAPGFIDGRDAILQADELLYNGDNKCIIWEAFARRGLGFSADQGTSGSRSDGTEAFDLPVSCIDTFAILKSGESVINENELINYSFTGFNNLMPLTNVEIHDTLDSRLAYIPSSADCGTVTGQNLEILIGAMDVGIDTICSLQAAPNLASPLGIDHYDGFENAQTWVATTGQGADGFGLSNANPKSIIQSWFVANAEADNTQFLTSPSFTIGANQGFSFWHDYNTESGWDGGLVEISTDGTTWIDLGENMIYNGYNGALGTSSNADIAGRAGFTGNSNGYINTVIDVSEYDGQSVNFRFVFGSDNNTVEVGWYVDDIALVKIEEIPNVVCISSTEAVTYCDTISTFVIPDCDVYTTLFADTDGDTFGNPLDSIFSCEATLVGYSLNKLDCDDTDATIYPTADELCDGLDNDCDGDIDEICSGSLICQDVILTIPMVTQLGYVAEEVIESDAVTNMSTSFFAGDTISLENGFEVLLGDPFEAIIEPCTPD